jgi:hypothetical protein
VRGQHPYSRPTGAALPHAGILSATAAAAVAAGFGGPVGAWLIMGIGLCSVCLSAAACTARAQRRSVVRP